MTFPSKVSVLQVKCEPEIAAFFTGSRSEPGSFHLSSFTQAGQRGPARLHKGGLMPGLV